MIITSSGIVFEITIRIGNYIDFTIEKSRKIKPSKSNRMLYITSRNGILCSRSNPFVLVYQSKESVRNN